METVLTRLDYTCQITVPASDTTVFEALTTKIPDWWTQHFEGAAAQCNDIFKVHFGNTRKTMQVVEIIPNRKLVWQCLEAYIAMESLQNKREWEGTTMIWEIQLSGDATVLTMTHIGLNTAFECYTVCEEGWDFFIKESLHPLLTLQKGNPHTKS